MQKKAGQKRTAKNERPGQLSLFEGGKVVSIHQLSVFEEALMLDKHRSRRAKDRYVKAVDIADSTAGAYCNLGISESEGKNFGKAIDYFTLSWSNGHFSGCFIDVIS